MKKRVLSGLIDNGSKRFIPALLAGIFLVSISGILLIGAAGQVHGQDIAQSMSAHGPAVAHNQTELADLIAVNGSLCYGSPHTQYMNGYVEMNATYPSGPISIGNTSSCIIITNFQHANASLCSIGYQRGADLFLNNIGNVGTTDDQARCMRD